MKKQLKSIRKITKSYEFPEKKNSLSTIVASECFKCACYQTRLTLLVGSSVFATFVNPLSTCRKI